VTITRVTPAVKLVSSANPSSAGSKVTFTTTVTGSGAKPTGTVTFYDGASKTLGKETLAGGKASLSTGSLAAGAHSIHAVYSGDSVYSGETSNTIVEKITD